jgi:hypothetical protein
MEFREHAASEASALVGRLLNQQSEASLRQLLAVREAIEAAARAIEAIPTADKDIQELAGRLNSAASTVVRRVREEARVALEAVRGELEAERMERSRLASSLADLQAQVEDLNTALGNEQQRSEAAEHELEATREDSARLEAARLELEVACRHEAEAKASLEEELRAATALLDESNSEAERVGQQLVAEHGENSRLRQELDSAREAAEQFDAARLEAEETSRRASEARLALETDLRETRELLDASTAEAARLSSQLDAETAEHAALSAEVDSARQALDAAYLRAEKTAALEAESRAETERELQDARGTLDAALADVERLAGQLESNAGEKGRLLAELSTSQEKQQALAAQLTASRGRAQTLERKLHEALQAEVKLREQVESFEHAAAGVRVDVVNSSTDADRARALDACLSAVNDLASATTIAGLLATLAKQLAAQFPRVAIFRVKSNRLEGEQQIGFDQSSDVTKLVIPINGLNLDSLLTRVVSSGAMEILAGQELADSGSTPFGGTPSHAVALPIMLQGETLAVVYADDFGRPDADGGADSESNAVFAKLVVRQTEVLLTRLTHELKTLTELRDYATLLIQEAEQMYVADADAGKPADELRRRLKDTIDCARQLFSQRATMEGGEAAALLADQIASIVESQTTPFAKDLAAVVGRNANKRRKAEAS